MFIPFLILFFTSKLNDSKGITPFCQGFLLKVYKLLYIEMQFMGIPNKMLLNNVSLERETIQKTGHI
jgi:hypothetical protein